MATRRRAIFRTDVEKSRREQIIKSLSTIFRNFNNIMSDEAINSASSNIANIDLNSLRGKNLRMLALAYLISVEDEPLTPANIDQRLEKYVNVDEKIKVEVLAYLSFLGSKRQEPLEARVKIWDQLWTPPELIEASY